MKSLLKRCWHSRRVLQHGDAVSQLITIVIGYASLIGEWRRMLRALPTVGELRRQLRALPLVTEGVACCLLLYRRGGTALADATDSSFAATLGVAVLHCAWPPLSIVEMATPSSTY